MFPKDECKSSRAKDESGALVRRFKWRVDRTSPRRSDVFAKDVRRRVEIDFENVLPSVIRKCLGADGPKKCTFSMRRLSYGGRSETRTKQGEEASPNVYRLQSAETAKRQFHHEVWWQKQRGLTSRYVRANVKLFSGEKEIVVAAVGVVGNAGVGEVGVFHKVHSRRASCLARRVDCVQRATFSAEDIDWRYYVCGPSVVQRATLLCRPCRKRPIPSDRRCSWPSEESGAIDLRSSRYGRP